MESGLQDDSDAITAQVQRIDTVTVAARETSLQQSARRHATALTFPQKLILAFAVAVGIPLFGYAAVMYAITDARMKMMDEMALSQRVTIADQHIRGTGLALLHAATTAPGLLGQVGKPEGGRADQLTGFLKSLSGSHHLSAAGIIYPGAIRAPRFLGRNLKLDAAIAESSYAKSALAGRRAWGLQPQEGSLAVVAAAPLAPVPEAGGARPALVIARSISADDLARVLGCGSCTAQIGPMDESVDLSSSRPAPPPLENGLSGFDTLEVSTESAREALLSSVVLRSRHTGAPPVLLKVAMERSALPGRGPRFATVALCAFSFTLLLAAFLTSLVTTWVSRPLDELRSRSEALARGERTTKPLTANTRDALGRVAVAFNRMVANQEDAQKRILHNERLAMAGKMAAAVAHEVKNVLSPIQLRAEMLLDGVRDPVARDNLEGMRQEISQGTALLRNLLEFARGGSREFRAVCMTDMVHRATDLVSPQLKKSGVTLALEDHTGDALVWGDQAELLQLVANLVNNAREANAKNITVRTGVENGVVTIIVRDDGVGMDPGTCTRAFEPFFTTKPSGRGTGLGLSICHGVVEAHGGTIAVESTRNIGTRIVVTLPTIEAN